jgi:RHS repeat-associated protein
VQTYDGQKIYYWDTQGRIIGEQNVAYAGANTNTATVRYIYSGNQKVAMARPKNLSDLNAGEDIYYFVNNAQGTPVLIVDAAGKSVSKINLDEWGNPGTVEGSRAEINYTGKKLDARTGLYYFNQRYYDPEIGRFLTEDPAGDSVNPYMMVANNPNSFIDPLGLWRIKFNCGLFGFDIGDKGVGVTVLGINGRIDFRDGSFHGGVQFGFEIDVLGQRVGLVVGAEHDFTHGGKDVLYVSAGVSAGMGGVNYNMGISYNSLDGKISSGADWVFDLDQMQQTYRKKVKEDPDMSPGKGVAGDGNIRERKSDEPFVPHAIAWGNPLHQPYQWPWVFRLAEMFVMDVFPGREGGLASTIANQIPGQAAFSRYHDSMGASLALPGIPFAQITTYGAYLRGQLPE